LCAFFRRLLSILIAATCIALHPYFEILLSTHLSIVLAVLRVGLLSLPWGLQSTVQRILLATLVIYYFSLFSVQVMP
jgi:hypothetical protein